MQRKRLSSFARSVLVNDLSLGDFLNFSAREAWDFLKPNAKNQKLFRRFQMRTMALNRGSDSLTEVGLGYLTLDRAIRVSVVGKHKDQGLLLSWAWAWSV